MDTYRELDKLPGGEPIATHTTEKGKVYYVYADGALYRAGLYPYFAGYVMDADNIACAVDAHEEDLRCMMDEFL